ncbi:MAG: bifunctional DNA-formamidopyrimidine glycosylase/DNA-(apurinic or apyrimidinic site) lyase [Actinomycetota bacterium]|nr:bifunctional DNA-formamidopyrimidine glycosylase/DNA-(apurinic or apyrimidinic site) lyase [Actinomycetota bacterium]
MPELPEVEVVRRGLARWAAGRSITAVEVLDPRSVRRHSLGVEDFRGNLLGASILDVVRRGKFLWMPLADDDDGVPAGGAAVEVPPRIALMAHLGMSGQLLMQDPGQPDEKHLKVRLTLSPAAEAPDELRFVDQRIFGGLFVTSLVPTADGLPGGQSDGSSPGLPLIAAEAAHIGRDPLDPAFSMDAFYRKLRARKTGLKRALLDQGLVSGIGNIYADEALWAAKLHYARPTDTLRRAEVERVIQASRDVMLRALEAGGTSFDSLYVNVNGASGYFERALNAYGREGEPCLRCAGLGLDTRIRRDTFMNRSSYSCPVCQPRPRNGRW